jgi:hypothetical protein
MKKDRLEQQPPVERTPFAVTQEPGGGPGRLDVKAGDERTCDGSRRLARKGRLTQIIAEMLKEALAFEAGPGAS